MLLPRSARQAAAAPGPVAPAATGDRPAPKKVKRPRSHWDMLMERRSVAELEEVLAERLAVIRGQRSAGGHDQAGTHSSRHRKSA